MEILLPALVLVLFVLLGLALAAPALVVVLALALPVGAVAVLARLLRPQARRAEPAIDRSARATPERVRIAPSIAPSIVPQDGSAPRPRLIPQLETAAARFESGEALFAFDRNLKVVSWNTGAAELTGIPAEQALGRPCWELLGGVDANGELVCHAGCPGARLASPGPAAKDRRLLIKTAAGGRRAAWLSTIAVRGGDEPLTLHLLRDAAKVAKESEQQHRTRAVG